MNKEILEKLKTYFASRDEVVMAFLFGWREEGRACDDSDWDIGVYFRPKIRGELETKEQYVSESKISGEVTRLLGAETDVVVLNRARPSLVFDVLNSGEVLANKDETLYLELLSKTHYEAVDYWNFVKEFWDIRQQATSLTPKARALLVEHLTFLDNETIKRFEIALTEEKTAEKLAEVAELTNLVVHEYLDLRFARIKKFIEEAGTQFPLIIEKIKGIIKS